MIKRDQLPSRWIIHNPRHLFSAMKLLVLLLATSSLLPACSYAKPNPKPPPPEQGRLTISLDDAWRSLSSNLSNQIPKGWTDQIPPSAEIVDLPITLQAAKVISDNKITWYWLQVEIPSNWKGQLVRLEFDGLGGQAEVWVNGARFGPVKGGAGPTWLDVTNGIHPDAINLIAMSIDGATTINGTRLRGIWQSLRLVCTDDAYIESLQIEPQSREWVNFAVQINNTTQIRADAAIILTIYDPGNSKHKLAETQQVVVVSPGLNLAGLLIKVKKAVQWGPDHPMLYPYRLEFRQGMNLLDNKEGVFGFRSVADQDGRLLLNEIPYPVNAGHLNWLDMPADSSLQGYVNGIYRKARLGGIGELITAAGAPDTIFEEADRYGMPLIVDLPDDLSMAKAVMVHTFNHPSVIAWLIPTSSGHSSAFITELKALDPARPVIQSLPKPSH